MKLADFIAQAFLERKLREERMAREYRQRFDFVRHRRSNPSHQAWKKRRAGGRH